VDADAGDVQTDLHDTLRLWTAAEGNIDNIKLAFLLLFFFPGIPSIFYGDEIALAGGKDPDNRRAMEWGRPDHQHELLVYLKRLIAARKKYRSLREGDWQTVVADDRCSLCVFLRRCREEWAILIMCCAAERLSTSIDLRDKHLPGLQCLSDRVGASGRYCAHDGILEVGPLLPRSGLLLVSDPHADNAVAEIAPNVARSSDETAV
jgi:glycosidase